MPGGPQADRTHLPVNPGMGLPGGHRDLGAAGVLYRPKRQPHPILCSGDVHSLERAGGFRSNSIGLWYCSRCVDDTVEPVLQRRCAAVAGKARREPGQATLGSSGPEGDTGARRVRATAGGVLRVKDELVPLPPGGGSAALANVHGRPSGRVVPLGHVLLHECPAGAGLPRLPPDGPARQGQERTDHFAHRMWRHPRRHVYPDLGRYSHVPPTSPLQRCDALPDHASDLVTRNGGHALLWIRRHEYGRPPRESRHHVRREGDGTLPADPCRILGMAAFFRWRLYGALHLVGARYFFWESSGAEHPAGSLCPHG